MEENIKQEVTESKQTWDFASLGEMIATTNPKTTTKYSKDDISNYLTNTQTYSSNLRAVSDYFYVSNGIYKNVINSFANLATLDNIILPSALTLERKSDKSYAGYYDKVNAYAESIDIKLTTREILKSVAKYGGYVAYERNEGSEYYLQSLPLNYCRIKYKVGHDYQLEFNFKYFDKFYNQDELDLAWMSFPPEFKKLYNKYKNDKKSRSPEWQLMDIKRTVCILPDEDEANFVPMFSGMFEALLDNEEMKDMIALGEKLDITKLLVQKVPTDKDGNILMPKDLVQYFHNELKKILPEGANGVTTPMDINDVAFSNSAQSKEELLAKAERGAFVASGWSGGLFADNAGHTGLQMNVEVVTSNIYAILEKIESMFNRRFKTVASTKTYEFKLQFYRTTNVNVGDNFDRMFKMLSIGGAIEPLISLCGFDPRTYATLLQVETDLGIKDLLVIPQSMHTQNGNQDTQTPSNDKGGNPKKQEKDLTNDGAKSRNVDTGVK
jgi:hypothetical protein